MTSSGLMSFLRKLFFDSGVQRIAQRRPRNKYLRQSKSIAIMLCKLAASEEESIMTGATVLDFNRFNDDHGSSNY